MHTEVTPYAVAFHPTGELLAVAGDQSPIEVWEQSGGAWAKTREYSGARGRAMCVAFSPNGDRLAAGVRSGSTFIWDVASGNLVASFTDDDSSVLDIAFAADGGLLAILTGAQTLIRHIDSGELVMTSTTYTPSGSVSQFGARVSFGPYGLLLSGRFRQGTELLDTTSRRLVAPDYASYMRDYRFDSRSVRPSPFLNLYRQQHIPLQPVATGNYLAQIQGDATIDSQRRVFRSFLRARNLVGAATVLSKLDPAGVSEEREQFVSAAIETANGLIVDANNGQANRYLDLVEPFAPDDLADLWVARAKILHADGRTGEAIALLDDRIGQSSDSSDNAREHLFALGKERLQLRIATGDLVAAKADLGFLFHLKTPPSLDLMAEPLQNYLAAAFANQDENEKATALTAATLIKGYIAARRTDNVDLNQYPELEQLAAIRQVDGSGQTVIAVDSTWSYHEQATPGARWMDTTFDDSQWPSGSGSIWDFPVTAVSRQSSSTRAAGSIISGTHLNWIAIRFHRMRNSCWT